MEMIGKKSGRLTIVKFSHTKKKKLNYWIAKCDCGNEKIISTGEFNRERTPVLSCGCYKPPIIDYVGQTFNSLSVLKFDYFKKGKSFWICQCECGNKKTICSESFIRNRTKSCGCLRKPTNPTYKENIKERIKSKIKISDNGCWEWTGPINKNGYGSMALKGIKTQTAHRSSYFAYKGDLKKNMLVCHHCNNKKCVNPEHLYLGTVKDNVKDMIERGQFPKGPNKEKGHTGEKNCKAKLDEEKVKYIKFLCENGFKKSTIADFFNVHKSQIHRISKGATWNHI